MGDGGKIELQDLIPDMTLTTIFINFMTLGGLGTGAEQSYKTNYQITSYDIDNHIHDKNSDSFYRGTKKKRK